MKTVMIMVLGILLASGAICCDLALAGPIDNADQAVKKAVRSAEKASTTKRGTGKAAIEWQNVDVSDDSDSGKQADQQGQQLPPKQSEDAPVKEYDGMQSQKE